MKHEADRSTHEKRHDKPNYTLRRLGAAVALAATIWTGAQIVDRVAGSPTFSPERIQYIVGAGEGVGDAAAHIKGIGKIDSGAAIDYIMSLPENKKALSDLQPGMILYIPKSVTP